MMTVDDIDQLSGAELEFTVAEKVFGWKDVAARRQELSVLCCSTNIAQAWDIVERIRQLGWHMSIDSDRWDRGGAVWDEPRWQVAFEHLDFRYFVVAQALTVEVAICRVALKVVRRMELRAHEEARNA